MTPALELFREYPNTREYLRQIVPELGPSALLNSLNARLAILSVARNLGDKAAVEVAKTVPTWTLGELDKRCWELKSLRLSGTQLLEAYDRTREAYFTPHPPL